MKEVIITVFFHIALTGLDERSPAGVTVHLWCCPPAVLQDFLWILVTFFTRVEDHYVTLGRGEGLMQSPAHKSVLVPEETGQRPKESCRELPSLEPLMLSCGFPHTLSCPLSLLPGGGESLLYHSSGHLL